ncbi:hypothetical protein [Mycoplasma seminis]|uniref:Uncharacterized protein n=1 Tax=Mycoplasma seminis TaxID=512749 RepID=A0ABY9H9J1_9MOLU|nr:hypothetical protein [Mycoplasma seminis]WLP85252.1 hypothetical protein Q8852_02930 [Mycoplasma seminis]
MNKKLFKKSLILGSSLNALVIPLSVISAQNNENNNSDPLEQAKKPLLDSINVANIPNQYKEALIAYLNTATSQAEVNQIATTISPLIEQIILTTSPDIPTEFNQITNEMVKESEVYQITLEKQVQAQNMIDNIGVLKFADAGNFITKLTTLNTQVSARLKSLIQSQDILLNFAEQFPLIVANERRTELAQRHILLSWYNSKGFEENVEELKSLNKNIGIFKVELERVKKAITNNDFEYKCGFPTRKQSIKNMVNKIQNYVADNPSVQNAFYINLTRDLKEAWVGLGATIYVGNYERDLANLLTEAKAPNLTPSQKEEIIYGPTGWGNKNGILEDTIRSARALNYKEYKSAITALNSSMGEMKYFLPKAKEKLTTIDYLCASASAKDKFSTAINTTQNILENKNNTINQSVINQLLQSLKSSLDGQSNFINATTNLTNKEKEVLQNNILTAPNAADASSMLQSASNLNNALGDIVNNLTSFAHGEDKTKAQNDIKIIQENVIKQENEVISQPQDYIDMFETINSVLNLETALNTYKDASVFEDNYLAKKSALQQGIQNANLAKMQNITAASLQQLKKSQEERLINLIKDGNDLIALVEGIEAKNQIQTTVSLNKLISDGIDTETYNNLKLALDSKDYFRLINDKLSANEISNLTWYFKNLDLDEVVKSALLKNIPDLKNTTNIIWWIYLTIVSILTFISAIIMMCFKAKKH